ncbi:hypothetical protein D029_1033 [Vibrio parahaemolyticus 970107]|nr:hypothetical protein D029_1033 [Vibrio parahaemolyticus 970107]
MPNHRIVGFFYALKAKTEPMAPFSMNVLRGLFVRVCELFET